MEIRPETIEIRLEQDLEARKASIMAMLSHELKSPLHGITGLSSSLLDDTEVPLSVKKPLSMMQNCAKRLLDMVSDLEQNCWIFDFSSWQLPNGKIHENPQNRRRFNTGQSSIDDGFSSKPYLIHL